MSFDVYWEGLGLHNLYSGIGRYAQNVRQALLPLGVQPKILGGEPRGRLYHSKVFHPWVSRWELGFRPPAKGVIHGLANTNLIPCLPGFKQILTLHDVIPLLPDSGVSRLSSEIFSRSLSAALKRADVILVPSVVTQRDFQERYPAATQKVRVLGYGFSDAQHTPSPSSSKPLILMVSRWEPYKGFDDFVEVVRQSPQWNFKVVTDLVGKSWLEEHCSAPHLEVATQVSSQALKQCYVDAHVIFQPSYYEGFGLPVVEGLAKERPVVFRKGTAAEEFAPKFLDSAFSSPDEAVAVVKRLLNRETRLELREWLAGARTWESYARDLTELYRDMMN